MLTKVIKQRLENRLKCLSNLNSVWMTTPRQTTCVDSGMCKSSMLFGTTAYLEKLLP